MSKAGLVYHSVARAEMNKATTRDPVDRGFAMIGKALAHGTDARIQGIAAFSALRPSARTGSSPQIADPTSIPISKTPSFKTGKALTDVESGSKRP